MSDSEDSTVTYTQISSPFADSSEIGSPRVDGPPIMPDDPYAYVLVAFQAPPSPDYVPGPKEPQAPLPLDFVPEPFYSEFMPPDDEEDVRSEEDPADYPADRDDDDEEEEPSGDDTDDKKEDEEDEEDEKEEYSAPADSVPPPPVHRMTARISIRAEPSISLPPREEVERLLALTTPPPSPLTPLSSPLPYIPSPLLLPILAPISSPPVLLPPTDRRADRPEVRLPPRKRLCSTQGLRYEVGESSSAAAFRPTRGRGQTMGLSVLWIPRSDDREPRRSAMGLEMFGVETLVDDSQYHYKTARLLDQEALVSREAWGRSIEVSYMTRSEIMALRSIVMSQQIVISQLQAADRRSQTVTSEMLQADHMRQAEIASLRTFDRTRQEQLMQTLTLMQSLQG
ncbi:hypothetical protein Tco_0309129 [Tanacetum coccineum]